MKKLLSLALAVTLALTVCSQALALKSIGEIGNPSTFETLQEAHLSSPAAVQSIMGNTANTFVGHPSLDNYPEGTTWVYRSANLYGGAAAARLNTNIFVYTEEKFADKDAAKAYLQKLGLIDIIEEAKGSLILVNPIGDAFGRADVASYYALQTAMLDQKDSILKADGSRVYYSDAEYFGGYGYVYFVGVDGGATFYNNYIASEIDYAGRLAGALLIGGDMQKVQKPVTFVPLYLVNASSVAISKYLSANTVDASLEEPARTIYFNQAWPLRKVILASQETVDVAEQIHNAYYDLFVKAMRVPVLKQGLYSGGTPFSGYNFDEAPYSLCDRCAVINGKTDQGVYYVAHQCEDRFSDIQVPATAERNAGEYLDVWYEYLPEEVLNNTAPAGSIPLILANHGGGDDPRVFVEEFGLLELAGKERVAVVAPDHSTITAVKNQALEALVNYMLATYPALDASRVYMTGYSMGGGATYSMAYYKPEMFAAIAPFAGSATPITDEQKASFKVDLPIIMSISAFDPPPRRLAAEEGNPNEAEQGMIKTWCGLNGIELGDFDFDKYPLFGFQADAKLTDTVNDEFARYTFYMNNKDGEPRFAFTYVMDMIHALYPEYAFIAWDFMKNFSRDQATGAILYNPNR